MRSSQEPIIRSRVIFISRKRAEIAIMVGKTLGFALATPMIIAISQQLEAIAAKSASP